MRARTCSTSPTRTDEVFAGEVANGALDTAFSFQADGPVSASLALGRDTAPEPRLYVADETGMLYALSTAPPARVRWTFRRTDRFSRHQRWRRAVTRRHHRVRQRRARHHHWQPGARADRRARRTPSATTALGHAAVDVRGGRVDRRVVAVDLHRSPRSTSVAPDNNSPVAETPATATIRTRPARETSAGRPTAIGPERRPRAHASTFTRRGVPREPQKPDRADNRTSSARTCCHRAHAHALQQRRAPAARMPFAMWFAVDDDGTIWMTTYRKSQKAVNVARNPKVALHIESGDTYDTLRGVCIRGDAAIVDDLDAVVRTIMRVNEKMMSGMFEARPGASKSDPLSGPQADCAQDHAGADLELGSREARRRLLAPPARPHSSCEPRHRHGEIRLHPGGERYRHLVLAKRLDGLVEANAAAFDRESRIGQRALDVDVRHRSEELTLFAGARGDGDRRRAQLLGEAARRRTSRACACPRRSACRARARAGCACRRPWPGRGAADSCARSRDAP